MLLHDAIIIKRRVTIQCSTSNTPRLFSLIRNINKRKMAASPHMKSIGDFLVDIDVDNMLGGGNYGRVFAGNHVRTGKPVAAKMFMPEKKYVSEETDREAHTMMDVPDHENVIKILDYIKKEVVKKKDFCSDMDNPRILSIRKLGRIR